MQLPDIDHRRHTRTRGDHIAAARGFGDGPRPQCQRGAGCGPQPQLTWCGHRAAGQVDTRLHPQSKRHRGDTRRGQDGPPEHHSACWSWGDPRVWPTRHSSSPRDDSVAHPGQRRRRQRRRGRRTGGLRRRAHPRNRRPRRAINRRRDKRGTGAWCVSSYSRNASWGGRGEAWRLEPRRGDRCARQWQEGRRRNGRPCASMRHPRQRRPRAPPRARRRRRWPRGRR
jgi:hypothetical protein